MTDSALPSTQFLKLVGHNIKVPVRSAPNAQGTVLKYLSPNDIIEVKVMDSKNFYRLADGLVRPYCYEALLYYYYYFDYESITFIGIHQQKHEECELDFRCGFV